MTQTAPSDAFDLSGRHALVTGASRGIGRSIAIAFARRGADVMAVARSETGLRETAAAAADASGSVYVHAADLRDPDSAGGAIDRAVQALGGLDILVNNAASDHWSLIEETDLTTFQDVLQLDLQTCWLLCKAASPVLTEGASVINVASMLGTVGGMNETAYIAAKHGLVGLTRALALEWGARGVRVNALAPGWVETANTIAGLSDESYARWVVRNTPLGRWAQPEEMGGSAIYLASAASAFMTGQVLVVDGGWTAR